MSDKESEFKDFISKMGMGLEKDKKLNEIKSFKIEQMVKINWNGLIELKEDFVNKHLRKFMFSAPFNYGPEFLSKKLNIKTNTKCPFCDKGILILTDKRKDICEVHVCHNGNSYRFECSENCKPYHLFTYSNQWLFC